MKKQIPAMLLGIACIVLLAAFIQADNTIKQLRTVIAEMEAAATIEAEPPALAVVEPMHPESAESAVVAEEPVAPPAEVKEQNRRMMENIAKMMENPTMNKVMEASQRGTVGALYADLIEYLDLDAEETRYFMDLLMYRQMKQVDLAMKMMSGGMSPEEEKALTDEIEKASELVQTEMEKFLNSDEDFAEFEYYEKTMGERMMLSQLDKDLEGTDAALTDATYRDLLGIMYEERNNFEFTGNLQDQDNMDMSPQRFSQENVQHLVQDIESLNAIISRRAEGILTPEQFAAFQDSLRTATEMQMAQIQMAAQMFGGEE